MKRDKFACNCKNITYGMIEDCIKNGADSYEDVEKQLRFGVENVKNLFGILYEIY